MSIFSCGCSPGRHNHHHYWSFSRWGFPQLQTDRILYPFHAEATQVPAPYLQYICSSSRIESEIQTLPLSSLSSLVKSADTGNGVTFHSGDNVDLGPSHIGVSFIDTAMQMVSEGKLTVSI